jgi:hypothetical protein
VCGWEQKGILEVHVVRSRPAESQTLGGNVVTWVCTPDRRVLHAIPGAPGPDQLLAELQWAVALDRATRGLSLCERRAAIADAHASRGPERRLGSEELVSASPYALVEELERPMFEQVLGQVYDTLGALVVREVKQLRLRGG